MKSVWIYFIDVLHAVEVYGLTRNTIIFGVGDS